MRCSPHTNVPAETGGSLARNAPPVWEEGASCCAPPSLPHRFLAALVSNCASKIVIHSAYKRNPIKQLRRKKSLKMIDFNPFAAKRLFSQSFTCWKPVNALLARTGRGRLDLRHAATSRRPWREGRTRRDAESRPFARAANLDNNRRARSGKAHRVLYRAQGLFSTCARATHACFITCDRPVIN